MNTHKKHSQKDRFFMRAGGEKTPEWPFTMTEEKPLLHLLLHNPCDWNKEMFLEFIIAAKEG